MLEKARAMIRMLQAGKQGKALQTCFLCTSEIRRGQQARLSCYGKHGWQWAHIDCSDPTKKLEAEEWQG